MPPLRDHLYRVGGDDGLSAPVGFPLPRKVQIDGRTYELPLHIETWLALEEICSREGMGRDELLAELAARSPGAALRRVVEVFTAEYFRKASAPP